MLSFEEDNLRHLHGVTNLCFRSGIRPKSAAECSHSRETPGNSARLADAVFSLKHSSEHHNSVFNTHKSKLDGRAVNQVFRCENCFDIASSSLQRHSSTDQRICCSDMDTSARRPLSSKSYCTAQLKKQRALETNQITSVSMKTFNSNIFLRFCFQNRSPKDHSGPKHNRSCTNRMQLIRHFLDLRYSVRSRNNRCFTAETFNDTHHTINNHQK